MPRPLTYTDIADALEAQIHKGIHKPGDRLPTQQQLALDFEVGYTTVAKAIALLKDRGLVYSSPPKGVFVAD